MDVLLSLLLDDAEREDRRIEDRGLAEARRARAEAEAHVESLTAAAKELGFTRGEAASAAMQDDVDAEIAKVHAGALDSLFERFQRRLVLATEALRDDERYGGLVRRYAQEAFQVVTGPVEVGARAADRALVYDALIAAGFSDFSVVPEPRLNVGFVVRDLDGRLLFDARPAARISAQTEVLRTRVEERVPQFAPPERSST